MANSTLDFNFLVQTSSDIKENKEEYDFICKKYEEKCKTPITQLCREANSHLIVYTYDQNVNQSLFSNIEKTKTFKMVNMRCEKDLKDELDAYFRSSDELCVIIINYKTEAIHLPLLLFLIENAEHREQDKKCYKEFIIVLHYTRIAAAMSDEDPLHTISFLNRWSQVFIENLTKTQVKIEQCESVYDMVKNEKVCLKELFLTKYQDSLKRFEIKSPSEDENPVYQSEFMKLLLEATNDSSFQALAKKYLVKKLEEEQGKPNIRNAWKKEILYNKNFASLAVDVDEAAKLYATKRGEDYLGIMMNHLLTNQTFTALFPKKSLDLLALFIPGIEKQFTNLTFDEYMMKVAEQILLNSHSTRQLLNLNHITITYPRVFPYSQLDQSRFLTTNKSEDLDNDVCSIAFAIQSLDYKHFQNEEEEKENSEDRDNSENELNLSQIQVSVSNQEEAPFKGLNNKFRDLIKKMTYLTKFDDDEKCVLDMYSELEKPENSVKKELYLLEMRNEFIEKFAKTNLTGSLLLDKIIRKFLPQNFSIADYLLVLLRGNELWSSLLHIYNAIDIKEKNQFTNELFLPELNLKIGFDIGTMVKAEIEYVKALFSNCERMFGMSRENRERMDGSTKYVSIFKNTYMWLIKLQSGFSKFELTLPETLIIWKNFVELIESISKEEIEPMYNQLDTMLSENQGNALLITLDDFLEALKSQTSEESQERISKFQATILYHNWILEENKTEENKTQLVSRLMNKINNDKYFGKFCNRIMDTLIYTDDQDFIYENHADLDEVLAEFDNDIHDSNYSSNIATIITDFFDKVIEDQNVIQNEPGESNFSKILEANFEKFSLYFERIQGKQCKNNIQVLYIMAFFKHYMRSYAACLLENTNYAILHEIDKLLSQPNSVLAYNLGIFTLKLLRLKKGSYQKLRKFLFDIRRMSWIEKFEEKFQDTNEMALFVPKLPDLSANQADLQKLWDELAKSDFSNKIQLREMITLAGKDYQTQYFLLNLLLINVYIFQIKSAALQEFIKENQDLLKENFNEYQINLMTLYANPKEDNPFFKGSKLSSVVDIDQMHIHILVLNNINWVVCLSKFQSPLTSLFFVDGQIPDTFNEYFQKLFIIAGLDNPYVELGLKVREECRYRGVYICSNECDYMYTIENCGWPRESKNCPCCSENIGNAVNSLMHTLARVDKGARRLGPKLESNKYVTSLRNDEGYWRGLEKSIDDEIDRIREKRIIKHNQGRDDCPAVANLTMTGYNRKAEILQDQIINKPLGRITRFTDIFLRFILHSTLYVMGTLNWILPEEILKILPDEDLNKSLEYLKDNIEDAVKKMQENLDCNDSLVWIIGLQQMLPAIIKESHEKGLTPKICKDRDNFETKVQDLLNHHLGDKKTDVVRAYKHTGQVSTQNFDSLLCEEDLNQDYLYLKILRLSSSSLLDKMCVDYEYAIQSKYPIIDGCVKHLQEIEKISKLIHIVKFSNHLMVLVDFQMTRKEAEELSVHQFIESLPKDKAAKMSQLLELFLDSWNNLHLGCIQMDCHPLGTPSQYNKDTPLIAFLVDSMQGKNQYGKMLCGVIHALSELQNDILNLMSARVRSINKYRDLKLVEEKELLPQNCGTQDILDITRDIVEEIVFRCSASDPTYGKGISIYYDFEAIQFNLILKIIGKKLLSQNISHYQNVKFTGEVFSVQSRSSSHITDLRRLGLTDPIPNLNDIQEKFKQIEASSAKFYSVLRQVLGSLEKLMIFYKNLAVSKITIADYVKMFKFNAISPHIEADEPIKSYDIGVIVSLYEWVETINTPYTWRIIPNVFKLKSLTDNDKKELDSLFKQIKEEKDTARTMPTIQDIATAISRFAARCLVLDDENEPYFKPHQDIMEWIVERDDVWPHSLMNEERVNLRQKFPDITFDKIFSLNEFIQNTLAPQKEFQKNKVQAQENTEKVPDASTKKRSRTRIYY